MMDDGRRLELLGPAEHWLAVIRRLRAVAR